MPDSQNRIIWPERYRPERTAVHVRNEITINATPETVWAILIRAYAWPDWYPNCARVRIAHDAHDLTLNAYFTWRTFGAHVRSTVREFTPYTRIAWDGAGPAMDVYHAWLIQPRAGGCHVLTEETQNGLIPRAMNLLAPKKMFDGHEVWLGRLKAKAESK